MKIQHNSKLNDLFHHFEDNQYWVDGYRFCNAQYYKLCNFFDDEMMKFDEDVCRTRIKLFCCGYACQPMKTLVIVQNSQQNRIETVEQLPQNNEDDEHHEMPSTNSLRLRYFKLLSSTATSTFNDGFKTLTWTKRLRRELTCPTTSTMVVDNTKMLSRTSSRNYSTSSTWPLSSSKNVYYYSPLSSTTFLIFIFLWTTMLSTSTIITSSMNNFVSAAVSTPIANHHNNQSSTLPPPFTLHQRRRSPPAVTANSASAEYFYAQDKLSDAQVEQFLHSLMQNSSSNNPPSNSQQISVPGANSSTFSSRPRSSSTTFFLAKNHHQPSNDGLIASKYLQPQQPRLPPTLINTTSIGPIHSTSSSLSTRNDIDQSDKYYQDLSQWLRPVYVAPKRSPTPQSSAPATSTHEASHQANNQVQSTDLADKQNKTNSNDNSTESNNSGFRSSSLFANVTFELKDEQWVAPVLALSTLNMLVILAFECFVIYRACRTCPSRRHLFLGQMLLLGLFLSSAMGLAFVPKPSWLSCSVIRAGLGISFTVVYAALLVKTVFLLSLHTGVYLSAEYQALLMFFIISTQVAIDGQWIVHTRSSIIIDYWDGFGHPIYRCDHSTNHLLWSLCYVIILIVILCIMTCRIRGYRENHGEALFLGIVSLLQIIVWLVWIAGTLTSTPHYRDGFVAFGIVGNATLIFMIMFLPKGRQLAAVGGRDSLAAAAANDQLSTTSSPSMYAQSFLHLKTGATATSNYGPVHGPISTKHHHQSLSTVGYQHPQGLQNRHHHRPSSSSSAYHHLYGQKFHGTGTSALLSDVVAGGTNSTTITQRIPNSFSSQAIFNLREQSTPGQRAQSHPPSTNAPALPSQPEDDDDPNYSNLSQIFTTSSMVAVTSSSNDGSKTSPLSENISSHSSSMGSGGSGHHSGSHSHHQSQNSSTRAPSVPKSKRPSKQQQNDSTNNNQNHQPPQPPQTLFTPLMPRNAGNGFFYLQPPPLPPPPPNSNDNNSTIPSGPKRESTPSSTASQRGSWRQSGCYTSNFASVQYRHYYPGPKSGSYHPSLPPVPSTPTGSSSGGGGSGGHGSMAMLMMAHTPIGHMPPPSLVSPSGTNQDDDHHSISSSSNQHATGAMSGFYFGQFDKQPTSGSQRTNISNSNNPSSNLKYFRDGSQQMNY